jgi:hypothetical protein
MTIELSADLKKKNDNLIIIKDHKGGNNPPPTEHLAKKYGVDEATKLIANFKR